MAHRTDEDLIQHEHNSARFFVEHKQVAWAALVAVIIWGIYGYMHMPQRKDPEIAVRVAVATCFWPGATAQQVEQMITRPMEDAIAQNRTIHPAAPDTYGIRSISMPGAAFVYVQLSEDTKDTREQFSDINLRLASIAPRLPHGATGIQFQSDFGDTAALMLTVASPTVDDTEVLLRARSIQESIQQARTLSGRNGPDQVSIAYVYPSNLSSPLLEQLTRRFISYMQDAGALTNPQLLSGSGFLGVDATTTLPDQKIQTLIEDFMHTRMQSSETDPDVWAPVIIRSPQDTFSRLRAVAGDKYTYAQLEEYTDLLSRTFLGVPQTSRVERKGVQSEQIYLDYSQERLAGYGLQASDLGRLLAARNITQSGGSMETESKRILLNPSGQFDTASSIGDVIVAASNTGAPVYLRDLVRISRGYQTPPQYLNSYTWQDKDGNWHHNRAITIAVYMRSGEQIKKFGQTINEALENAKSSLPPDLVIARTSDQPLQVKENIDLFMQALAEAIGLVVLIALVGFWEWRSALLMALSIPITLAMTFGMAYMVKIDLQQVSIATLIIALGLLVDNPVVANDAVKRELATGVSRHHASWLGPTKLATAILYATITNIIAYLPFLMLDGSTGEFLYTLPIMMTAALVASRIVSMTFIPLLSYYLLRPDTGKPFDMEEHRTKGFYGFYYRMAGAAIQHRWKVLAGSLVFLLIGALSAASLKTQFFPEDVQYWSYVDIWLPNDAPLSLTSQTAQQVEQIIRRVTNDFERKHPSKKEGEHLLHSLNTFIGGGGPRFWFSVSPEQQQKNYAQIIIQVNDKEEMPKLVAELQAAFSKEIPQANLIVHQLQINPVEFPVDIQISGPSDVDTSREEEDIRNLRQIAGRVQDLLRPLPGVQVVQNDWFPESPEVNLKIDPDRANLSGITNYDIAGSTSAATAGVTVASLREGNKQIPVVARLRSDERAQLSDLKNLYVYSSQQSDRKLPLMSVASLENQLETGRIRRQEHFRTISVHAYPQPRVLASQVLKEALPGLKAIEKQLPSGYRLQISGEQAKQEIGFKNLSSVLIISLAGIYAALLMQFRHAVKPLLVFAAAPYGVVGALIALAIMKTPFGFMAFLAIASLIGVIISHVIVLFDCIEDMREKGEPLEQALRDAGIVRLRPVIITVAATILALFPLALHGGPLWQPLCYAQIGGLAVATFITLLLVPVLYSIFVLDLKIVPWVVEEKQVEVEEKN